ncbi:hypothetical protein B0O41_4101 [Propionibacteriaceae bacterium ES.041]|uniref:VOC family protein n=1 Tax=Enemella evansiae TaxID=2016499 RepID=UPI000C001113|nr:VOC family protein [Enemella evansiae]PFG69247.1 hypothetical protein B0O41_4101 [Propionibacteriaceae bacterium ES.041]
MTTSPLPPMHLAIPVQNIEEARDFYGGVLGLARGRSDTRWTDWNFHGHQLVTHEVTEPPRSAPTNPVDGHDVPVPHFGLVLPVPEFHALAERIREAGVEFVIEPYLRFEGQPGEQWTMFFVDPSGNNLEFKAFADPDQLFAV